MALTLSYANKSRTGTTLRASVERISDGLFYDTSDSTFKAIGSISGTNWAITLTEGSGIQLGKWTGSVSSTPEAQWADGKFRVSVHDGADSNKTIGVGEVMFHNGDEVDVDADPLDIIGEDGTITVHQKLGSFSGVSGSATGTVKDAIAANGATNVALSVLAGEFQIVADLERVSSSTQDSLDVACRREHAKVVSFTLRDLAGAAIDLTGKGVRVLVQNVKGQGATVIFDYNSTSNPSKVEVYSATAGKFRWNISENDSDISETGGDGAGAYAMELLYNRNTGLGWELLVGGRFIVETGADLLPA